MRVHTAQGRLTGWILAVLPIVLGLILYVANPGHMSLLWRTAIGIKMLYGALVMALIGAFIIHRIVQIRV